MSDMPDTADDSVPTTATTLYAALKTLFVEPMHPEQSGWCIEPILPKDMQLSGAGSAWFGTENSALFRIDHIMGRPIFYAESQIDEAATILDSASEILQEFEARLGIALEPVSLVSHLPNDADAFVVRCGEMGAETMIGLAFAPGTDHLAHLQVRIAQLPQVRETTLCKSTVILACPAIDVDAAAALDVGDMLLLGDYAPARIVPDPVNGVAAWNSINDGAGMPDGVVSFAGLGFTAGAVPDIPANSGFQITPMLCIPDVAFLYGPLSRLQAGDVLQLPPLSQGTSIRLMLGDSVIANGQITQSGQICAFIIDALAHHAQDHAAADMGKDGDNDPETELESVDMTTESADTSSPNWQAG